MQSNASSFVRHHFLIFLEKLLLWIPRLSFIRRNMMRANMRGFFFIDLICATRTYVCFLPIDDEIRKDKLSCVKQIRIFRMRYCGSTVHTLSSCHWHRWFKTILSGIKAFTNLVTSIHERINVPLGDDVLTEAIQLFQSL